MKILRACLIAFAVVLILLGLGGWYAYREYQRFVIAPPAEGSRGVAVAVVSSMEGGATLERGTETRSLAVRDELLQGDVVTVATSGRIAIVWPEYGRTLLDGGTRIAIREAATNSSRETLRVRLRVEAGRVWTRLQRLLGKESSFTTQVSDVIATVRGTSFGHGFDGGRVWVKVKESSVAMVHASSEADVSDAEVQKMMAGATLVQEGQAMEMTPGAKSWPKPRVMTDAEQRDDTFMAAGHEALTDAELRIQPNLPNLEGVDLERLWNSLPKWLQDFLRNAVEQNRTGG